jgi:outer membrane lipoprotein-sorting protein
MTPDPLDRAADALRNSATTLGPSPELTTRTLAALAVRAAPVHPSQRRFVMRLLGYGSLATAAAVLVGVGLAFFGTPGPSAAAEFQKAMAKAAQAKTLIFTNTQKLSPNSPEIQSTVSIRDMQFRIDLMNPGGIDGAPTAAELPVTVSILVDRTLGKSLQINHFAKSAQWEAIPDRFDFPDLISGFRNLGHAEGITLVGEENLGTVATKKYTMKTAEFIGGKGDFHVTVWLDAKTNLPVTVRVETSINTIIKNKKPMNAKSVLTFGNFQFDTPLPDDRLKLEAPKGFKVSTVERNPKTGESTPKIP